MLHLLGGTVKQLAGLRKFVLISQHPKRSHQIKECPQQMAQRSQRGFRVIIRINELHIPCP